MNTQDNRFNIYEYWAIALRRKWCVIIPLMVSTLISFAVYKYLPKVYKATTLILVQPQKVPETYVRSTITASVTERLHTTSQQILSRTRLEQIIQEFNLFREMRNKVPAEGIVEKMRKAIEINLQGRLQNTFSISFQGEEPRTVMMVTNKLASLFIEENLKVREVQAEGTSEFLNKELQHMEKLLIQKEREVQKFKERHMGELPQQLDANLRILERLQQQFKAVSESRRAAEDRTLILKNQMDQLKTLEHSLKAQLPPPREMRAEPRPKPQEERARPPQERAPEDPLVTQWNHLQRELAALQSKYTETHPDVLDLKRKIAKLTPRAMDILEKARAAKSAEPAPAPPPAAEEKPPPPMPNPIGEGLMIQMAEQYNGSLLEMKRLKEEEESLRGQIALYQKRIEDTPSRESELILVMRDYDLLKTNYQSLMNKKIQAQMSENLEKKQQGEQFKVLDPARLPETPIWPDLKKLLLIGAFMGLVSGLGLAWLLESRDQSFYAPAEVEDFLKLPVLAEIPNLESEIKMAAKG